MSSTFSDSGPAARWLLAVCSGSTPEHWPVLPTDAERLLPAMARAHRLASRAGGRLAAHGLTDSAPARALVSAWREGLGEQALFAEALGEIDRRAAEAGIEMLALKGADLSRRIYPPGERTSNDIDLLVRPEHLAAAEGVLAAADFACDHPDPLDARRYWFASTYRNRVRPRLQVDLHWALGARHRTHWELEAVFARRQTLPGLDAVGGMAREDLLVFLALHAVAFHGALARWIWWLDLRLLLADPEVEAEALLARAREVGGEVALGVALARTERLFGAWPEGRWPPRTLRSGLIEAISADEERAGVWGWRRRLVAGLAVDRPGDLLALVAWAAGRAWRRRRG